MESKIIICDRCKGSGKREERECAHYHFKEYNYWDEPCSTCGGSGRMVEEVIVRKLLPEELELRKKPLAI